MSAVVAGFLFISFLTASVSAWANGPLTGSPLKCAKLLDPTVLATKKWTSSKAHPVVSASTLSTHTIENIIRLSSKKFALQSIHPENGDFAAKPVEFEARSEKSEIVGFHDQPREGYFAVIEKMETGTEVRVLSRTTGAPFSEKATRAFEKPVSFITGFSEGAHRALIVVEGNQVHILKPEDLAFDIRERHSTRTLETVEPINGILFYKSLDVGVLVASTPSVLHKWDLSINKNRSKLETLAALPAPRGTHFAGVAGGVLATGDQVIWALGAEARSVTLYKVDQKTRRLSQTGTHALNSYTTVPSLSHLPPKRNLQAFVADGKLYGVMVSSHGVAEIYDFVAESQPHEGIAEPLKPIKRLALDQKLTAAGVAIELVKTKQAALLLPTETGLVAVNLSQEIGDIAITKPANLTSSKNQVEVLGYSLEAGIGFNGVPGNRFQLVQRYRIPNGSNEHEYQMKMEVVSREDAENGSVEIKARDLENSSMVVVRSFPEQREDGSRLTLEFEDQSIASSVTALRLATPEKTAR
ncbi:MAG: hypothetical protein AB1540_13005 [Bdellovibrionota bacterium]